MIIKNGTAFIDGKFVKKDVFIQDGFFSNHSDSETFDARGMLVLPGLIDPHVHLREPGDTYKEDFLTGSKAAIAGGFTTVMDMPNNAVPTTTKERLEEKLILSKKAVCDILFHFGATDDNFNEAKATSAPSMKIYLGSTTGMMVLKKPDSLEKHFAHFPRDKQIVLHTSDHSPEGETNLENTYKTLSHSIEVAKRYDHKFHLAHASTKKEVLLAKKYSKCTVEVAPHYLFLSTKDLTKLGHRGKVYPILRDESERAMLWDALANTDCIATDHAPHTLVDKENGSAGMPGLETSLALMLKGCNEGKIKLEWLVPAMSENVAKIFNIKNKGKIKEGFIGDVTIVDPKKTWKVHGENLQTKCKWSPFEGMELKGKTHTVIKNGKVIYQEYEFI